MEDIAVNSLYAERYKMGKTKLYQCLEALKISTFVSRKDRRSYITANDLERLDEYIRILENEGAQAAAEYAASSTDLAAPAPIVSAPSQPAPFLPESLELFSQAIALQLSNAKPKDIFAPQRQLEEACKSDWLLKSRQLKEIIGSAPREGAPVYGFNLVRVRRGWWRVEKF